MLTDNELQHIREKLGREPNTPELAVFDALWSEHCSYKSSKRWFHLFNTDSDHVWLGIGEGAGLLDVGDDLLVGIGLESHNHPSAVDPFNGASTGVGGIVRDILSQGCRPVAILDCLRFGLPTTHRQRFLLDQVVLGISSYGNCIGVPNLGGDLEFSPEFSSNPLVNAMCVGIVEKNKVIRSIARNPGDLLVLFGARTGLDGIGGVTFASEILDEDKGLENRGSVQIGDPLTEKLLIDIVIELRDLGLLSGLQDLGGGGLACAAAEMAEKGGTGVHLYLERVPLKVPEMKPWEILVSESQERMLAVVTKDNMDAVEEVIGKYGVNVAIVGEVTSTGQFVASFNGEIVADLPVEFVVKGFPEPSRTVGEFRPRIEQFERKPFSTVHEAMTLLLSTADLSLKDGIFQQYDQHVQGNTICSPGDGAGSIMLPNGKSLVMAAGTNSYLVGLNPRLGTELATLEIARKIWAKKAIPIGLVDSLNFGNPENPVSYAEFVESIRGLGTFSHELMIPVVGGNVSLYNEAGNSKILPSPFVGMVGLQESLDPYVPQFETDDLLFLVGMKEGFLYGSQLQRYFDLDISAYPPSVDYEKERKVADFILSCKEIKGSTHIGRGGLLLTLAKTLVKAGIGGEFSFPMEDLSFVFGEHAPRYLVAVKQANRESFEQMAKEMKIPVMFLGVAGGNQLHFDFSTLPLETLKNKLFSPIKEALTV
ncbi:MAG: phosphoribosylformylglycinamidine synthase subunit PurL [Methanobacteriota archaeon]|nr:MAG: phosphoribosylformylglycinamidine synthase subunit PurL [Euryarchaeota archaeon]